METAEVSEHMIRVFTALDEKVWRTAAEVAVAAEVAPRTARAHLLRLVRLGLLDQAEVFPAHRYRVSTLAEKRNKSMVQRIRAAREAFGL